MTIQAFDPRVTTIGIFNSGRYDAGGTNNVLPRITKPIFFFLGGPSDIAYGNVSRMLSLPLSACVCACVVLFCTQLAD